MLPRAQLPVCARERAKEQYAALNVQRLVVRWWQMGCWLAVCVLSQDLAKSPAKAATQLDLVSFVKEDLCHVYHVFP